MADTEQDVELDVSHYVEILFRRRWIVILITILVASAAVAYGFLTPPVFRASTVIDIERETGNAVQIQNAGEGEDDSYFNTQYKLIASDTALQRVYDDLKLSQTKDFSGGLKPLTAAVAVVPEQGTRLCDINVDSTDPQLAVDISKTLAQYFVESNLNSKLFMSKDVLDALQSRMKGVDAEKVNESLPSVVNNGLIQGIKAQIFSAEAQLADLRMKYTDSHPAIISLKSRLASMHQELNNEVGNIVQSLKTELSGQLRANNVRIIDLPRLPDHPVRPRRILVSAFGLFGGLALGVFTAFFIELLDQTVRTHDDVEKRLGLPFLGLIPFTRHKKGAAIYAPLLSEDVSLMSEAFRNLRTMIGFTASVEGEQLLLTTSTVQEEGKSFVSTNLAVVLAQLGRRVLIVDGDLRRPRLHRTLQASSEKGLSDYLAGDVSDPAGIVQKTTIPNLDVVTCGPRPPNPAELLNTEHLAKFVAWARGRYAHVIVDCPPVFPISDTLIWVHHIKAIVFIARFGRTRVPLIRTACARLRANGARLLGGVINGARLGTMTYADGRYYEQYYRDYVDAEPSKKRKA
jgi:capsular exopolysaccharide synthesis family protein